MRIHRKRLHRGGGSGLGLAGHIMLLLHAAQDGGRRDVPERGRYVSPPMWHALYVWVWKRASHYVARRQWILIEQNPRLTATALQRVQSVIKLPGHGPSDPADSVKISAAFAGKKNRRLLLREEAPKQEGRKTGLEGWKGRTCCLQTRSLFAFAHRSAYVQMYARPIVILKCTRAP